MKKVLKIYIHKMKEKTMNKIKTSRDQRWDPSHVKAHWKKR
jgi:hypothetical protein